jgi:prepilin-type N-terminal cleavage/methylation domain-containing protein
VAIRPPKYNSQGFTLIEMLVVISIVGIVIGFAAPSLLALNKPLRDGTSQFKSALGLIRMKAISGNQAYRIRPKYPTKAEYTGEKYQQTPHNFIVEYAANCQVNKYGSATAGSGSPDGWQEASQFNLDLPEAVGIDGTVTVDGTATSAGTVSFAPANGASATSVAYEANLNWNICYDNRGLAYKPVELILKDFQGNNRAKTSTIQVTGIGQLNVDTKDSAGTSIPKSNGNSVF